MGAHALAACMLFDAEVHPTMRQLADDWRLNRSRERLEEVSITFVRYGVHWKIQSVEIVPVRNCCSQTVLLNLPLADSSDLAISLI